MPRELDLGAKLRTAERRLDPQFATPSVVPEVVDREREPVEFGPIEHLKHCKRQIVTGSTEVKVGRESARVARAELPQCGTALEYQALIEEARSMEQVQHVVLSDVEQRGIASALRALIVTNQMAFGDAAHAPPPTLRYW